MTTTVACRSCGADSVEAMLDLGQQPLANAFRRPDDPAPEARYPLVLGQCGACGLAQLMETVRPGVMFDDYLYFSSYSPSWVEAARTLALANIERLGLGPDSFVVEVASNDGYLLQHYQHMGVPVLGVDPAANVAAVANERGIPTEVAYFTEAYASALAAERGRASVIHANNVIAHVPDTNDFMAGFAALLADDGVLCVETPSLVELVERVAFDTIYHEHVFVWSLTSISRAFERHGLVVTDLEHLPTHGGSLRLFVRHRGHDVSPVVTDELERERELGVGTPAHLSGLASQVEAARHALREMLKDLRDSGHSIAGYGAAAKGTVLCNHFGLDTTLVDFVADRNEHKQGRLVPGAGIPVVPAEAIAERRPDYVLLFVWNLSDEIISQEREYVASGGRFIVPLPKPRVEPA